MTQTTTLNIILKPHPSSYESPRDVGDVLVGDDAALLAIEASSSGNEIGLKSLLSQPRWIKIMQERPHRIYDEHYEALNDKRSVAAAPTLNLQRAMEVAAQNGRAAIVSALLDFAKLQQIDTFHVVNYSIINHVIRNDDAASYRALASADPRAVNYPLLHGVLPLYEAVRLKKPDVVAVLLEFGADPLHPVQESKELFTWRSSLMSWAAMDYCITKMLLEHNTPVGNTGALHTAACYGKLEVMRLLIQHGADVNEPLPVWHKNHTPMHFAAEKCQANAMKLLEENGARSDAQDDDGKTPAQVWGKYL